jgi:hypothetical protein
MAGVSAASRLGIEAGFDLSTGTIIDMASSGEAFGDAFMRNLLLTAVGSVGGKVQAAAASRYGKHAVLGADLTKPFSVGMHKALRKIGRRRFNSDEDVEIDPGHEGTVILEPTDYSLDIAKHIMQKVFRELMNSTDMAWIIGSMIQTKDLQLKVGRFVQQPGARGMFTVKGDTIYINESIFRSEYGHLLKSPAAIADLTGTIVHEGVHFLGGGEIAAHLAQGQYLAHVLKQNPKLKFTDYGTDWWKSSGALAKAAATGDVPPLMDILTRRHYGVGKPKGLYNDTVKQQPLHQVVTDLDGFEALLSVKQTSLMELREMVPAGNSF